MGWGEQGQSLALDAGMHLLCPHVRPSLSARQSERQGTPIMQSRQNAVSWEF